MIEFPDHTANRTTYPTSRYSDLLYSNPDSNGDIKSAYQYYQQESGGSLDFTGSSFAEWVIADNDAAHYGAHDGDDKDKDVPALVLEAVTKAVAGTETTPGINLSDYDLDNDGIIDHVMIFHSSIGEEAGGGTLGDDAIWSHRFYVFGADNKPVSVPGSDIKLYGYTINPLDAQVGVVSHEFGHDLGVPDEYDTGSGQFSSPVAYWSIMASGSWVDGGAHPSGFSPYAKDYFQTRYGGNWINQQEIEFDELTSETISLVTATNHEEGNVNQVKVNLPLTTTAYAPYAGDYQFYSTEGHDLNNSMSFDVTLPAGSSELSMKAHWDIETDWDYLLVTVNDTVIAGNHTRADNTEHDDIHNFISDKSSVLDGAEGDMGWVDLTFDLTAYENQSVTIKFEYITDTYESGYGFVADNISVTNGSTSVFTHDAEDESNVILDGFIRSQTWNTYGDAHHYFIQLRNHTITDTYLADKNYDEGVLVWYRDTGVSNNQVNNHAGKVFTGVVDADQNAILSGTSVRGTSSQIRDAAFSLFGQSVYGEDNHLTAISSFDDKLDYSTPYQPESGIITPTFGLTMGITAQAADSSTASISLTNGGASVIKAAHNGLAVTFSVNDDDLASDSTFEWQVGDNTNSTEAEFTHTYTAAGSFDVSVTYQATSGEKTLTYKAVVGDAVTLEQVTLDQAVSITGKRASFSPVSIGGQGALTYRWNFGDDSDINQSETPIHDYEEFGTYNVTLTVVDETLQSFVFASSVVVENVLSASFTNTISNLLVNFTATAAGGDEAYTYSWDFGDSSTLGSTQRVAHTYGTAGTYTVTLTVTDGTGATVTSSRDVTVTAAVIVTPPPAKKSGGGGGSFGLWLIALAGISLTRRAVK
jgi:immune inhibitor A